MKTFDLHMMPPISLEVKHGGKNDRNLPMKYDGMVVVERNREGKGNASRFVLAESVMNKLYEFNGIENPKDMEAVKRIPIRFLSDSISENFNIYRAFFLKNTIACGAQANDKNDVAMRRFRKENGQTEFVEPYEHACNKDCPIWNSENPKVSCDIYGSLHFVLSDDVHPSGSLCVHRINGRNAQRRIMSSLYMIEKYTGGILANIPLCIAFHFENVPDHTGQLQKVPVMVIEPENGYRRLREDVLQEMNNRANLGIKKYEGILDRVVERSLVTEIEESSDWVGGVSEDEDDKGEDSKVIKSSDAEKETSEEIELSLILEENDYSKFMSAPPAMRAIIIKNSKSNGVIDKNLVVRNMKKYIK